MLLRDSYLSLLLGRRSYVLLATLLAALFTIYYQILEPANFQSFSETLRYFLSGLAALLAVVVSFNTLALRNQLSNMPNRMEALNKQLDEISNLLQPVIKQMEKNEEEESTTSYKKSTILYLVLLS
jgi:predicted PurR-regulated permease PerM